MQIGKDLQHRWEKLSPCSIDGSSNMKKILAEHIENLQKNPSSKTILLSCKQTGEDLSQDWMFHEMLPFKYVLAFELNLCCTCTVSTDNGCRFIHLCHEIIFSLCLKQYMSSRYINLSFSCFSFCKLMDSLLIFIHVYINFLNEIEIALGIDAITETMEAHCLFCIGIMD